MSVTLSHPTLPPVHDGAVCVACRAPLGAAARYCLGCGARQAAARIELLDLVVPAAAAVPPVPPASVASLAATGPRTWPFAVTAAVLVALVVGLGVGRLLADGRDAPSGPQVIRIEGPNGAVAPPTGVPAATDAPAAGAAPPGGAPATGEAPAPAPVVSGGAE